MSATNATANYNLPLFIGTDKPAWLTDWNGAMNAIDGAIANVASAEGGTATSLATLTSTVEALSGTVSGHTTSINTLTTAVSGNTGAINTINSLIGNGQPTTTDKTIIGAINELHAEIGGGSSVTASAVSYDNTVSGMTADDVQEAIDELKSAIDAIVVPATPTASDVSYSNTASGLSATNVQGAIDELAGNTPATPTILASFTATNASEVLSASLEGFTMVGVMFVNETSGDIFVSNVIPVSYFKTMANGLHADYTAGTTYVIAKYVDDTHASVTFNGGAGNMGKIFAF